MKEGLFRKKRNGSDGAKPDDKAKRPGLWSTRSRSWLPFDRAVRDLVLLGDGTLVAAIEVAPVDIALMSQEDVRGYIARYWQGLRSIHFPVSIYVGTRRQELTDYLQEVTLRLDQLAQREGEQEGFLGMLLEEQCQLLSVLLAEHLRSRYTLLVVSHNPNTKLEGAIRSMIGTGPIRASVSPERLVETQSELELKLKKVEDVLRQVGLKYLRCSGRRLAVELLRLSRPELMAEEIARLEVRSEPAPVVLGDEGGYCEVAFSPQR